MYRCSSEGVSDATGQSSEMGFKDSFTALDVNITVIAPDRRDVDLPTGEIILQFVNKVVRTADLDRNALLARHELVDQGAHLGQGLTARLVEQYGRKSTRSGARDLRLKALQP